MDERILIVEDETRIAALLRDYLQNAGYTASLLERGDQVIGCVRQYLPDLILLDIMLPGLDGIEICREIRKFSGVPIIMITARVEEVDRLIGLELGADDYICKPFSPREVVARVKAVLRRVGSKPFEEKMVVGPISVDKKKRRVMIHDEEIKLTPNEFTLLWVMMAHPDRVFTRNELIDSVQGYNFDGYDRTIDTHVKNLRKKLAALLPDREVIGAVYGVGYRMNGKI
ncbi:MAG: response regulator [Deltaproteobacteria bacterium]|nr:response regulator [Deltaproteobacteria bacterium]